MILATNNKGKLKEIREIFSEYNIYSLNDKDIDIDVVEDETTFYGNALKKVSTEYKNVYVYDGYNDLGINSFNKYVYFGQRDKTHPNDNGIRLYAYKLGKFIESLES